MRAGQILEPLEGYLPGIDRHPNVADQRDDVSHAHPPDDPYECGRDVVDGSVCADEPGHDQQDEDRNRERSKHNGRDPARQYRSSHRRLKQVQARIVELPGASLYEHPKHNE